MQRLEGSIGRTQWEDKKDGEIDAEYECEEIVETDERRFTGAAGPLKFHPLPLGHPTVKPPIALLPKIKLPLTTSITLLILYLIHPQIL